MNDYDIIDKYCCNGVIKFIHLNGIETVIKTLPTCGKNYSKAVLFISSSVGCKQGCKFCYLTAKKMQYRCISEKTIVECCKKALDNSNILDKYLKISFMGVGECFDSHINIHVITLNIISYALNNKLVEGIDGVDIGTSAPVNYNSSIIDNVNSIDAYLNYLMLNGVKFNPVNKYPERSLVRIFFSLHSLSDANRKFLMPVTRSIKDLNALVKKFKNYNIVFHYMCLSGVNDKICDILNLYDYLKAQSKIYNIELRILRFNKCEEIELDESDRIHEIIDFFNNQNNIKFKYQISIGKEINSSCGQFFCIKTTNKQEKK